MVMCRGFGSGHARGPGLMPFTLEGRGSCHSRWRRILAPQESGPRNQHRVLRVRTHAKVSGPTPAMGPRILVKTELDLVISGPPSRSWSNC